MKILLLHGWGYKNYKGQENANERNPWRNKAKFIDQLTELGYELLIPSFPGFIGSQDTPIKPWGEKEYVLFCENIVRKEQPDAILGNSFGGAVAVMWKKEKKKKNDIKIILVSPALERGYAKKSISSRITTILPNFLLNFLRDIYLCYVIKNPYYKFGNNFLKKTYLNIVKIKCGKYLEKIKPDQTLIIFGENDTATPPSIIQSMFKNNIEISERIKIIKGGDHDIVNTHTEELIGFIKTYLDETQNK